MAASVLETLKRQLDVEGQSQDISSLPADFYSKIASYSQRLKRSKTSGGSDAVQRLIVAQIGLIESMSRELLETRARKARNMKAYANLLPEERYAFSPWERYRKRVQEMVAALSDGQPSYVENARRVETTRVVVVKFTRHVDELVGLDLRRYGPFEAEDVASVPAASAEVLISGEAAVELSPRDRV